MVRELAHTVLGLAGPLGAILLFAAPGWALTECVPGLRRRTPARRAAYGYLLGVAAVAGLLFALSHLFAVPLRRPAVWCAVTAPLALGLAAAVLRRRRAAARASILAGRGHPDGAGRGHPDRAGRAVAGRDGRVARTIQAFCVACAVLVCIGLLAEAACNPVHDWDGRMTWDTQARYFRAAATVDAPVLQNVRWFVTHPQYPPLLPLAQVAVLEVFHADPDSHLMRAPYAAFFPVLLLLIWDGGRRAAGRACAALAVLAAAVVPFFALGEGGAYSTYSDLPLACFYGAAILLLAGPVPRLADTLAAGLLLFAVVLTKNEGLPIACAAVLLSWRAPLPGSPGFAAAKGRRRTLWLRLAAAAVPPALALALLLSWQAGIPNRHDEGYPQLLLKGDLWPGVLTHVTIFGPLLLRQMLRIHHWAGFWLMAAALVAAGFRAARHPRWRRWALAAATPPLVAVAAYSISTDPIFIAAVTWERFLLQGSVPTLVLLATCAAEVTRHLRARRRTRNQALPTPRPLTPEPPPPASS